MKEKKTAIFFIAVACFLVVFGAVLGIVSCILDRKITRELVIVRGDEISKEFEIKNLNLLPGQEDERVIVLKFSIKGRYEISFSFEETEDGGLKDYVDVTTSYAGEELGETVTLKEAFEREKITYIYEHKDDKEKEETLTVVYLMPETVGEGISDAEQENIMGAYAKFNLKLTVKRIL